MAQVAMIASRQLVWSYVSVSCVRYPLYELEGEGFGAAVGPKVLLRRAADLAKVCRADDVACVVAWHA